MQKRRKQGAPKTKRPPQVAMLREEKPTIAALTDKRDISSMFLAEIEGAFKEKELQAFRAKQVYAWLVQGVSSFDEMTNISKDLRATLAESFDITSLTCLDKQVSAIDGTVKFLWQLSDGNTVESVWMRQKHGVSICLSTQVGCRMGCSFCASAIGGFVRNLTAGEILGQIQAAEREMDERISSIVLMGMGEPLDNFDATIRFLKLVNHAEGKNIGMRHITLSTSGMIEKIDKLSTYQLQLSLAVSLHGVDDDTREQLMPINRKNGVRALLETCKRYQEKTGRRVSYEYALIKGINDSPLQARQLAKLMQEVEGHVNLIPLNTVNERKFAGSDEKAVMKFQSILQTLGVNVTLRKRKGDDIDAACGQLRQKRN